MNKTTFFFLKGVAVQKKIKMGGRDPKKVENHCSIPPKSEPLGRPKIVLFAHPHHKTGAAANVGVGRHEIAAAYAVTCINTLSLV